MLSLTLVITAWLHLRTTGAITPPKACFFVFLLLIPGQSCSGLQISALFSRQGIEAVKQPLEISSSVPSAASKAKPSAVLGSVAGDPGHAAWKTPAIPLGGHRPVLTPSHRREQMAVHVHVPTLPMSLCASCLPPAQPWHNVAETQGHWKTAQHKVKGLARSPPVPTSSRSPPRSCPCGRMSASHPALHGVSTQHEDIPSPGAWTLILRAQSSDTSPVTLCHPR